MNKVWFVTPLLLEVSLSPYAPTECKGSNRSGHIQQLLSRESNIQWILHCFNLPKKHFIYLDISSSLLIFISSGCISIYHAKGAPYTAKSTNIPISWDLYVSVSVSSPGNIDNINRQKEWFRRFIQMLIYYWNYPSNILNMCYFILAIFT